MQLQYTRDEILDKLQELKEFHLVTGEGRCEDALWLNEAGELNIYTPGDVPGVYISDIGVYSYVFLAIIDSLAANGYIEFKKGVKYE